MMLVNENNIVQSYVEPIDPRFVDFHQVRLHVVIWHHSPHVSSGNARTISISVVRYTDVCRNLNIQLGIS